MTTQSITQTNRTKAPLVTKCILIFLAVWSLISAGWAGNIAFLDTTLLISDLAMMGMFGYLFHALIIFSSLWFERSARKTITLLIAAWHLPEAILIGLFGMGVPDGKIVGVSVQLTFVILALSAWYLDKDKA